MDGEWNMPKIRTYHSSCYYGRAYKHNTYTVVQVRHNADASNGREWCIRKNGEAISFYANFNDAKQAVNTLEFKKNAKQRKWY